MKLSMKNNAGVRKSVPTGLSWTGCFFTYFAMWARGMIGPGFLWLFILSWLQGFILFTAFGMAFLEAMDGGDGSATSGITTALLCVLIVFNLLFLFKLNRWTVRYYLNRGFQPEGQGWSLWGAKYGIEVTETMKQTDEGLNPPKKLRPKDILGFATLFILAGAILSSASSGGSAASTGSTTNETESPVVEATPFTLNDVVKTGHMEWVLTEVRSGQSFSGEYADVSTGSDETILVWIFGRVTNRSNNEDYSMGDLYLVDSKGTRYGESMDGAMVADPLAIPFFNPNVPVNFSTIFEVPASAEGLAFVATDFKAYRPDEERVELGLEQN